MTSDKTLYQIIGVFPGSTPIEIRNAYWDQARVLHPDTGTGDTQAFTDLANAYKVLISEKTRSAYDKKLALTMTPCKKCNADGRRYSIKNVATVCATCQGVGYVRRVQQS